MNNQAQQPHHDRPGRKPARPHKPTPLGSHRHGKGWAPKGKNGMQRYRLQSGFAAMQTGKGPRKAMPMPGPMFSGSPVEPANEAVKPKPRGLIGWLRQKVTGRRQK